MGTLPLDGVRIADLTTVVMGPLATRMLADMGADVIRIEGPDGDIIRDYEPMRSPKMSAFSMNLNRNKRSIILDFKKPDDRAALDEIIAGCDVVVTNMRRSALARLGLDDAGVRAVSPDIIYCVANGYGSDGPKADHAAYDDVIQAVSGLASTFQWSTGQPQLVPSIYADKITGVHIAFAIAAALHGRATTGRGASIEVPMAETMAAFNLVEHLSGQTFEPQHGDFSYNRIRTPHRKPRRTADGWIVILPYSEDNWRCFWQFGGRPEFLDDPRFETRAKRVVHADDLYSLMGEVVATKSTSEWADFCAENSIPMSEVVQLEHIGDDPHFAEVGLIASDDHPTEGPYHYVRDSIRIDGGVAPLRHHAPRLGADTDAVLREFGVERGQDRHRSQTEPGR
ncbi:MAG: CaiB/BaiF CoA transferase family protein [Acidimicrobiales bacterium]